MFPKKFFFYKLNIPFFSKFMLSKYSFNFWINIKIKAETRTYKRLAKNIFMLRKIVY